MQAGPRWLNCREMKDEPDLENCGEDGMEIMDFEPVDKTKPNIYYGLTEPNSTIEPKCIKKGNYSKLTTYYDNINNDYYKKNPYTNTKIRCNEIQIYLEKDMKKKFGVMMVFIHILNNQILKI